MRLPGHKISVNSVNFFKREKVCCREVTFADFGISLNQISVVLLRNYKHVHMNSVINEFAQSQEQLWHLCTPGNLSGVLFVEKKDFEYGMNATALVAFKFWGKVKIYTFQLMSNHLHFLISGELHDVQEFFKELKLRLQRYFTAVERNFDMRKFECRCFEITNLVYLRNVLVYINRNGYLANKNVTPFSYKWGANRYFFNPFAGNEEHQKLKDFPIRVKREMFRTHHIFLPDNYLVVDGYVSPLSYCHIEESEKWFENAHHYFALVSRRVEAFADIARELADSVIYSDEELNWAAISLCQKLYGSAKPQLLSKEKKIEIARQLRFGYNSSAKQLKRLLKLDEEVVNAMFPERK